MARERERERWKMERLVETCRRNVLKNNELQDMQFFTMQFLMQMRRVGHSSRGCRRERWKIERLVDKCRRNALQCIGKQPAGRHVFFGIHNFDVDEKMTAKENAEIDGNVQARTSC